MMIVISSLKKNALTFTCDIDYAREVGNIVLRRGNMTNFYISVTLRILVKLNMKDSL